LNRWPRPRRAFFAACAFSMACLIVYAVFLPASVAAEPGWWTAMKQACRAQGGTISEYYNSYTGCHLPSQALPPSESSPPSESLPPGPHLISRAGTWAPEDGYDWVSASAGDFRVRWVPNRSSGNTMIQRRSSGFENGFSQRSNTQGSDARAGRAFLIIFTQLMPNSAAN
jgi:hypothetical protein